MIVSRGIASCILVTSCKILAPVVQTLDSAIHWINHYPLDNSIGFASVYPLDSDLSGRQRYPSFEQLGPGRHLSIFSHIGDLKGAISTMVLLDETSLVQHVFIFVALTAPFPFPVAPGYKKV